MKFKFFMCNYHFKIQFPNKNVKVFFIGFFWLLLPRGVTASVGMFPELRSVQENVESAGGISSHTPFGK